ncbi:Rpp20 subunit of nuclear RNase MRP and P [Teratosphaeria destructans]|uniref:Rpp20 subunit of nuclear RNase MRP and P n=1 Tax=Teratosphaeria destructans TaxID=418781 RepID=A0A9W7SYP9_9PEZI|nr:Rpp20 subunit of nuclear RNase MRP and P [Teratosphaeria destructans]
MAQRDSRPPSKAAPKPHLLPPTTNKQKLPQLPPTAKVTKRPLLRPAIPSPYANSSEQKVVYVSARTPFLSAVKRVEKLLALNDKRLVQAATTLAKTKESRKRKRRAGDGDEIHDIADEVERLKGTKRRKVQVGGEGRGLVAGGADGGEDLEAVAAEAVVIKGTGKAVSRVLEMALWFQQREDKFKISLKTGSVGAVDDVQMPDHDTTARDARGREDGEDMELDGGVAECDQAAVHDTGQDGGEDNQAVPQTRIRHVSVLEVYSEREIDNTAGNCHYSSTDAIVTTQALDTRSVPSLSFTSSNDFLSDSRVFT